MEKAVAKWYKYCGRANKLKTSEQTLYLGDSKINQEPLYEPRNRSIIKLTQSEFKTLRELN